MVELFERAIKAATGVTSWRLIDIARIKEMLKSGEIEEVAWVPGKEEVADSLTKEGGKVELIRKYMENHGEERKGGNRD